MAESTKAEREARDARLDALKTATEQWHTRRRQQLEGEAALAKKLLKGRTGAERLNNASVEAASELLVDELNNFLAGDLS